MHDLIVEHGKKRKIVQSLLLEIDEYKQKSTTEQDIKEARKIEQIQSMSFTTKEQIMLEEQKTLIKRKILFKKEFAPSKIILQHKKAYDIIMITRTMGFISIFTDKGMAEESLN